MPIYRFKVPTGSVSLEQREKIAMDVTDVHCGSTLAPRHFVHVYFDEQARGRIRNTPPASTWMLLTAPDARRK